MSGSHLLRNKLMFLATRNGTSPSAKGAYNLPVYPFQCEDMMASSSEQGLNPGDEAQPGTPGAAEDICGECSGSGKLAGGAECPACGGSGRVMRGIGGG